MHQKLFNVSINYHYLARTPLRMENHQPNSEAVQHHSVLFIFVLHPYAPKERKAVQPRHHRAAVPNLPRRTSFLQGFLHIPYSHTVLLRCFGPGPHSLLWLYSKGNQTCIGCWFCVLVFCAIQRHISKGIKGQSKSHMNPYDMMCSWKWIHGFRI